jgi:hydrogenase expression/formation protein HypE
MIVLHLERNVLRNIRLAHPWSRPKVPVLHITAIIKENSMQFNLNCPIPISEYDKVLMAHGGGGKLSDQLIHKMFFTHLDNEYLRLAHDGAILQIPPGRLAFSTDSYIVQPIFFPGGNIGELAVNGTVNDLSCCGAKPLYLSLAFIIEEGFPMQDLWTIVQSIKHSADQAGVLIVTGDTKVVEKGKGDKIFINTSGIGVIPDGIDIKPANCKPGDVIIVNGNIADHGIAVLSSRQGLQFETSIISDTAPLNSMVEAILKVTDKVHVLRDPTRGGLASSLNEIAKASETGIDIEEINIPMNEEVKGACEILGFDPLYIANEGKILVFVPESESKKVLEAMRAHPLGTNSSIIGRVTEEHKKIVKLKTSLGTSRIVDMISGEQLPRIC